MNIELFKNNIYRSTKKRSCRYKGLVLILLPYNSPKAGETMLKSLHIYINIDIDIYLYRYKYRYRYVCIYLYESIYMPYISHMYTYNIYTHTCMYICF